MFSVLFSQSAFSAVTYTSYVCGAPDAFNVYVGAANQMAVSRTFILNYCRTHSARPKTCQNPVCRTMTLADKRGDFPKAQFLEKDSLDELAAARSNGNIQNPGASRPIPTTSSNPRPHAPVTVPPYHSGSSYTDSNGTTHYSDGTSSYTDGIGTTHNSDGSTSYTDGIGTTHYSNGGTSYNDGIGTTHYSNGTTSYTDATGTTHYSDGHSCYKDATGTTHCN